MGEPSKAAIDEFIRTNDIDKRAATDLRECLPEIQQKVLARGDLKSARNPSSALLARIRDARVDGETNTRVNRTGAAVGLPSRGEIERFIEASGVDDKAAELLRSCSPTVKRSVLAGGELNKSANSSAMLLQRIKDAKSGGPRAGAACTLPSSAEVEDFIKCNDLDDSAAEMLRTSPPAVQHAVLSRDLKSARNPSSALIARIRDMKMGIAGPDGYPAPCGYEQWGYGAYPGGYPPGNYPPYGYSPYGGYYGGYPPSGYSPNGYDDGHPGGSAYGPSGHSARRCYGSRERSSSYSYSYSYSSSSSFSRSRSHDESKRKSHSRKRSGEPRRHRHKGSAEPRRHQRGCCSRSGKV